MIADRIKELREKNGISQNNLAKKLRISRSAVNAWEMGINIPSTQCVIELAGLFHVTADYILDISTDMTITIDAFSEEEKELVFQLISYIKNNHSS